MVAREMQIEFERLIQLANPGFIIAGKIDSDTIFYFLNAAQNRFIKLNYMSLDSVKQTVENLRKNTDSFKSLIVTKTIGVGEDLTVGMYGKKYKLPSDKDNAFFLYQNSVSHVSGTYMNIPDTIVDGNKVINNYKPISNKLITQDELGKLLVSYYNNPILRHPCAVLDGDVNGNSYITIYTDSYTKLKGCTIVYIRMPKKFNVIIPEGDTTIVDRCELDENVHQDIVELAVEMFLTEGAYRLQGGKQQKQDTHQQEE